MIRMSEMVLPGHPNKFCDQVADAIIAHTVSVDPLAYGQIEVATWSDQVWLSGGVCTYKPMKMRMEDIVVDTGRALGYRDGNWIDAARYKVHNTVCEMVNVLAGIELMHMILKGQMAMPGCEGLSFADQFYALAGQIRPA